VHAPAIERYAPVFDEYSLPQPVLGPVDLRPWEEALRALLTDRALYQRVSAASREAALRFAGSLDGGRMPEFLQSLRPGEAVRERPSLAHLSPEKRTLLLHRARSRKP
jgi:hypothetical protein